MKQRMIAAVCTALMLTACGNTAAPAAVTTQVTDTGTSAVQSSETSVSETTASAAESETEASTAPSETTSSAASEEETTVTAEEKPAALPVYTIQTTDGGTVTSEDDAKAALFEGKFDTLLISNADEYPLLSEKLSDIMKTSHDEYSNESEGLISTAKEHYSNYSESFTGEYPMQYYCTIDNSVTRCDDKVFSFINSEEGYGGGVHGWNMNIGKNIDSQTGEELALSDICTDIPRLVDILAEKLENDYSEAVTPDYQSLADYREVLTHAYGEDLQGYDATWEDGTVTHFDGMNFVFVPDGVMFFSNSYDLTFYAGGTQYLTVLFSEAEGLFNERYISVGGDFLIKYEPYNPFYIDTDNDGRGVKITSECILDDEWKTTGYSVKVGDKEYTADNTSGPDDYIDITELERKDGKYTIRLYSSDSELLAEITI
ncbi:MAG: hypothetical protein K6C13_14265 [Oscillospiraceae bacterium]|nr:hypothetical protein [Oscillospiraceae bacterium]